MASYNQIIKILEDFAGAHFIIKSFGNGHPSELVENSQFLDLEYPIMWADDLPNTLSTGKDSYKFRMYFLGQVATLKEKTASTLKESNINEVRSDQKQNALDLISYLVQQTTFPDLTTDRTITLTPITEEFNDTLTGWYFDLTINDAFRFSSCSIPMAGITPPPSVVCEDGTINIKDSNGNTLYIKTVPSGGVVNQIISDSVNTLNGGAISGILAEGIKAITLKDDLGVTIVPTINTDSLTNLDLEIPSGSTPLKYRSFSGQTTQYQTYDDGYYFQQGYYGGGILSDYYNLSNSDLTPWSHLKRFTGTTGGYYDEVALTYHDEDGTLNGSHVLSFPDGLINDHLNGYQWYYLPVGNRSWTLAISEIQVLTFKGFSDWIAPSKSQIQEIEDNEMSNPFVNGIFNLSGNLWCSSTVKSNTLQAYSFNAQGECLRQNKTLSKARVIVRKF